MRRNITAILPWIKGKIFFLCQHLKKYVFYTCCLNAERNKGNERVISICVKEGKIMFIFVPWKIVARPKVVMSTCCVKNSLSCGGSYVLVFGGKKWNFSGSCFVQFGVPFVCGGLFWGFFGEGMLFWGAFLFGFLFCSREDLWLCIFCGGFLVLWDFFVWLFDLGVVVFGFSLFFFFFY